MKSQLFINIVRVTNTLNKNSKNKFNGEKIWPFK